MATENGGPTVLDEVDIRTLGNESQLEHGEWSKTALRSAIRFAATFGRAGFNLSQVVNSDFQVVELEAPLLRLTIKDSGNPPWLHPFIGESHRFHAWAMKIMKAELDSKAKDANAMAKLLGFLTCRVESYDRRIFVYDCGNNEAAELFALKRQTAGQNARVDSNALTQVREQQKLE